jgi:hypothetical protein
MTPLDHEAASLGVAVFRVGTPRLRNRNPRRGRTDELHWRLRPDSYRLR